MKELNEKVEKVEKAVKEKAVKVKKESKGFDFSKKNKVSVWISQHPYQDIPEEYFEESFSNNNKHAKNTWSKNFKLQYFLPDNMETNGAQEGTIAIMKAAGECSYSASYMTALMSKAKKKKIDQITWVVLLFECEYSVKQSSIGKDNYLTFLGAFEYDDSAENHYREK